LAAPASTTEADTGAGRRANRFRAVRCPVRFDDALASIPGAAKKLLKSKRETGARSALAFMARRNRISILPVLTVARPSDRRADTWADDLHERSVELKRETVADLLDRPTARSRSRPAAASPGTAPR
jgi:aryl-alcohol dehydrogenase-like predicted oxidoreductase